MLTCPFCGAIPVVGPVANDCGASCWEAGGCSCGGLHLRHDGRGSWEAILSSRPPGALWDEAFGAAVVRCGPRDWRAGRWDPSGGRLPGEVLAVLRSRPRGPWEPVPPSDVVDLLAAASVLLS